LRPVWRLILNIFGGLKMNPIELVLGIVLMVLALFLIVAVLMQQDKDKKLSGTITGGADTYYGKGKGKSRDKILARATTVAAILFAILVVAMYVIVSMISG
jgi:preprotein translocase subunit SecG